MAFLFDIRVSSIEENNPSLISGKWNRSVRNLIEVRCDDTRLAISPVEDFEYEIPHWIF